METTDGNKIALAVMTALLGTMALGVFSNAIYAPGKLLKPGYALPGASEEAKATAPAAPADEPLPPLLAKADATKGQTDTKICQTCHNFEKGAGPKLGPPLWGVVGRPIASIAGFSYSDGLKGMKGDWTYDELFKFLKKPSALVPGTKMTFSGDSDPQMRANILAYLRTLSDAPVPLPAASAPAPAPASSATPSAPPSKTPAPPASATPSPAPSASPSPTPASATPSSPPSATPEPAK